MTDNTEALQYADLIDRQHDGVVAATIIRELVAENEALKNALQIEEVISFRRQMQTYAELNAELVEALQAVLSTHRRGKAWEKMGNPPRPSTLAARAAYAVLAKVEGK